MGRDNNEVSKNKKITKDNIVQQIAAKGNGFNPFLIIMNFKITLKTWIKHARQNLKKMEKERKLMNGEIVPSSTTGDQEPLLQQYTIEVEIDVEKFMSETSEEDEEEQ